MQPQVIYDQWIKVEHDGTDYIQASLFTTTPTAAEVYKYTNADSIDAITAIEVITGYGARLSMPGYLDCTEWTVFETLEQAWEHLINSYDLDDYAIEQCPEHFVSYLVNADYSGLTDEEIDAADQWWQNLKDNYGYDMTVEWIGNSTGFDGHQNTLACLIHFDAREID